MSLQFRIISLSLALIILLVPINGVIFADENGEGSDETTFAPEQEDDGNQTIEIEYASKWKCSSCGQSNGMDEEMCIFCYSERDENAEIITEKTEVKMKNLRWQCPHCDEFTRLGDDICFLCGEPKPTVESGSFPQLFVRVSKNPTLRSVGKGLMLGGGIGFAISGGLFVFATTQEGLGALGMAITSVVAAIISAFVFVPGLVIYLVSRASFKMIPVSQDLSIETGCNSLDNYRLFADEHQPPASDIAVIGFGFTF